MDEGVAALTLKIQCGTIIENQGTCPVPAIRRRQQVPVSNAGLEVSSGERKYATDEEGSEGLRLSCVLTGRFLSNDSAGTNSFNKWLGFWSYLERVLSVLI